MSELRERVPVDVWSAAVPLMVGTVMVVVRPSVGVATGALLLAGVALGLMRPDRSALQGALVATPLVVTAVAAGLVRSWQLGALALVAAPFAVGTISLAAVAGGMMQFGDRGRRRRAGIMIAIVGVAALAVITLGNAGRHRIASDEHHLQAATVDALGHLSSLDLMTGAYDDTWARLGDAIGSRPLISTGTSSIELRFDITPTIAPWLTRCLTATVQGISEAPIAPEAVSFTTTNATC